MPNASGSSCTTPVADSTSSDTSASSEAASRMRAMVLAGRKPAPTLGEGDEPTTPSSANEREVRWSSTHMAGASRSRVQPGWSTASPDNASAVAAESSASSPRRRRRDPTEWGAPWPSSYTSDHRSRWACASLSTCMRRGEPITSPSRTVGRALR
eukprot:scaffold3818_cov132-Isochrysis_galbana.AAC.4